MSRRTDQWIGNDSSTKTIARKVETGCRVLAQQCEIGRMRAVGHGERAAEIVLIFRKGHLRLLAEGYVPKIDLLRDARGGSKPGDPPKPGGGSPFGGNKPAGGSPFGGIHDASAEPKAVFIVINLLQKNK